MGWYFLLITLGCFYALSYMIESAHTEDMEKREQYYHDKVKLTNSRAIPKGTVAKEVFLCRGSVVIGANFYRRFVARLKQIIGGHLRILEGIIERAYREATLRMISDAYSKGAAMIINVRYETTCVGRTDRRGNNTSSMMEVFVYGTAVIT